MSDRLPDEVVTIIASGEDTRTCENTCDVCNAMMVSLAVEVLERRQERCDRCRHWVPEEGEPDGVCKELSEWTDPDFYCGYWEA